MAKRQIITKLPPIAGCKRRHIEVVMWGGDGGGGNTFQEQHSLTNIKQDNKIHR